MFLLLSYSYVSAQIIQIRCFDQNNSISQQVNNLLINGGFENSTCSLGLNAGRFCPNSYLYSCDISNWTCTGGGVNTYATIVDGSGSSLTCTAEGVRAVYFGNSYSEACTSIEQDTSCFNNINCEVIGIPLGYPSNNDQTFGGGTGISLEQTVNGLVVDSVYVLEFWAGGESYSANPFGGSGLFALNIGFGNTFLKCKPTSPLTGVGTRYLIDFKAVSSSHTIKFTNWGHICDNCTELVLDDVRLYTLKELSSFVNTYNVSANLTLYPNPATTTLTLTTEQTLKNAELKIMNAIGQLVSHPLTRGECASLSAGKGCVLDISSLPPGLYYLTLQSNEGVAVKKFEVIR